MAGVLQTSQPLGERFTLPASNSPGNVDVIIVDTAALPGGVEQPFRGTFFVDPLFTGVQTGSMANPFTTIAAAFAAGAAQALTRGIITLAPGANCIENVVFPLTGDWEIACSLKLGVSDTTITGNVDISSTATARRSLTCLSVTGNLTGNCSAGTLRSLLTAASIAGTTTLTVTGAGVHRLTTAGVSSDFSGVLGGFAFLSGAVSVAGTVQAYNCQFGASLAISLGPNHSFVNCALPPVITTSLASTATLYFFYCNNTLAGPIAVTALTGICLLRPDFATVSDTFQRIGLVLTGNVQLKSLAGASATSTSATNVGTAPLGAIVPAGLQVIEACLTLLANGGTAVGLATLNVVYTDATGVLVTEAVTTALNVAGAVGSKARGSLPFTQNGGSVVSYNVTGITVATGLSYRIDVAIRQAG